VDIIEDAGKSGKDLNREAIHVLTGLIKARAIDVIVVYKLDRLSRRVIDTLFLLELIEKHRVAFHAILDRIDTKTAMGKFFLNMMASLNQMERDLISERTRDALRLKITKHERAGQVPYGWKLSEDGRTLLRDERKQKTIAHIKELSTRGLSFRAICRELEKDGHQPAGKAWHPKTIGSILKRAA